MPLFFITVHPSPIVMSSHSPDSVLFVSGILAEEWATACNGSYVIKSSYVIKIR